MLRLFFILLFFNSIFSIRDPFYFGQIKEDKDNPKIICNAIGNINNNKFALLNYKSKNLTVRIGDKFNNQIVSAIEKDSIIFKNANGRLSRVFID